MSALIDGFTDYIFLTIDLADPRKPEVAGRWWLPGMHQAGGETPDWPQGKRYALHHAIIAGDTAYGSWRDGGLTLLDVKDRTQPNDKHSYHRRHKSRQCYIPKLLETACTIYISGLI